MSDTEAHRQFLKERFEKLIFNQKELEQAISVPSQQLSSRLEAIEVELTKRLCDSTNSISSKFRLDLDEETVCQNLSSRISFVSAEVVSAAEIDASQTVIKEVTSELAGKVLGKVSAAMAVRLGISTATTGTGIGTSALSMGSSIAIGMIVDYLVTRIYDWFNDPEGEISSKVESAISKTRTELLNGNQAAKRAVQKLEYVLKFHEDEKARNRAEAAIASIKNSGNLGLRFELENYLKKRAATMEETVKEIVLGEYK